MKKRVVILGAGISGLAAGWFLKQQANPDLEIIILEKTARAGGWIETVQQDGFLFEHGPRSLRTKGISSETWQLIELLGLKDQLIPSHADANQRFIYHHQKLQPLPNRIWNMPFSSMTTGWLKVVFREFFTKKGQAKDESVHDFFSRRLSTEWADRLVDPFISGIFAGDTRKLSLQSSFPHLHRMEQEYGSLIKGALLQKKKERVAIPIEAPFFSFQNGMQTLTDTLFSQLKSEVHLESAPQRLILHADHVEIELANSQWLKADQLISAIPTYQLAALLAPKHPYFAAALDQLNYATVIVVNLGYRKSVLKQKGYGYLIPSQENESILGCVWDSSVFPQQNQHPDETRLTVMLGGRRHLEAEEWSEEKIFALAFSAVEKHLDIHAIPDSVSIKRAYRAIPQYELGYAAWTTSIREQAAFLSPVTHCIGNAFTGISVNECIVGAFEASQLILPVL